MDGADHLGQSVTMSSPRRKPGSIAANRHKRARGWIPAFAGMTLACAAVMPTLAQEIVPPATRDVTPPGITPGPAGGGPLVREPTPPRPAEPPRWRRFFLPITTDAASFEIDGRLAIRIAGVTPPGLDDNCRFADGELWPCGRTALHALRMFLRGRAVECYFPPLDDLVEVTAPCRVGTTDLGLWLLKSGWGTANDLATGEYVAAVAAARCANLGIWRGVASADFCPERGEPAAAAPDQESPTPWLPE
jgi:hypothetical protein